MRPIILKINLPTGNGKRRCLQGQRIKVSDADYARLVPQYAHDADTYLAADAERKAAFEKANPDKVKAFKAAKKERHDRVEALIADRAAAKKIEDEAEAKRVAARLAQILENERAAAAAKKAHDLAVMKAANPEDGNK